MSRKDKARVDSQGRKERYKELLDQGGSIGKRILFPCLNNINNLKIIRFLKLIMRKRRMLSIH